MAKAAMIIPHLFIDSLLRLLRWIPTRIRCLSFKFSDFLSGKEPIHPHLRRITCVANPTNRFSTYHQHTFLPIIFTAFCGKLWTAHAGKFAESLFGCIAAKSVGHGAQIIYFGLFSVFAAIAIPTRPDFAPMRLVVA